jgi:hypothetical protein
MAIFGLDKKPNQCRSLLNTQSKMHFPTSSSRRQSSYIPASLEDSPFITQDNSLEEDISDSPTHQKKELVFFWKLTIFSALLSPVLLVLLIVNTYRNWAFNNIHDEDAYTRSIFGDSVLLTLGLHPQYLLIKIQ